jgi:hypothetical protein
LISSVFAIFNLLFQFSDQALECVKRDTLDAIWRHNDGNARYAAGNPGSTMQDTAAVFDVTDHEDIPLAKTEALDNSFH